MSVSDNYRDLLETFESKASGKAVEAQETSDEDIELELARKKKHIIGTIM